MLGNYLRRVSARLRRLVLSWRPLCCSASVNMSNFNGQDTIEGCVKMRLETTCTEFQPGIAQAGLSFVATMLFRKCQNDQL